MREQRRCGDDGFDNLKRPMPVGRGSLAYSFCPAKATWDLETAELFIACRLAMVTGILPEPTLPFDEQSPEFCMALPAFIDRWQERTYQRVWRDVQDFTSSVLKSIFGG